MASANRAMLLRSFPLFRGKQNDPVMVYCDFKIVGFYVDGAWDRDAYLVVSRITHYLNGPSSAVSSCY
jgi:hypothetical protein